MDVKDCYVCQYKDRGISEKPCCECVDHSKYIELNEKMSLVELGKALALIEASESEDPAIEIEEKKEDMVHHPDHYAKGRKFEPKDVIRDWDLNFNLGSALKYIARAGRKDDIIQDLEKAIEYISFEIEALKEETEDE